jgi:hypothetical protein
MSIDIAFQNLTQKVLRNPTFHNLSCKRSVDLTSHIPSPKAKGCTNNVDGGNGDLAMQLHLWQKKTMKKNGNWDNAFPKVGNGKS